MNFKAVLKLFSILALKMSVVLTSAHETDKPSFPTECSEVPHRVRFRCYATQLIQGAGGVRSRGRVLKEGLPPVFDYETDNTREVDKTTKAESVQASAPKDAQDVDGKADPGPSAKQAMVTQEAETLQSGNATDMEIEKDWIVVWDESQVSSKDIRDVCASGLAGTNKTCQREYSTAVTGFSAHLTLNELEGVLSEHSARIKYAERDQVFSATMMNQTTNLPWGLDRIDSRYGRSGSYQYLNTGEGVNIYVLDTGVRITHEQFGYLNGSAGSRAQSGYDFIDDDSNADDCTGHGTHVAGTVAGKDYGVAKDARVHSVRVLDCYGSASTQAVIAGIDWTETNHIKPAVATMSLGGPASVSLDEATAALVAAGVTVAVAAGNDDWNACYNSPAREPTAITVGASDEYDSGATFTNYGSCVDLFAPGTNILSSHYGSDNGALTKSGTSMATPYVAGVAALYLQSNPSASPMELKNEVLNDATTNVLSSLGAGSPNKLLYSIVYPVSTAPTVVTSTPTGSPTSPTTSPSSAPTSPTTSPTAAPTSPTVSPTTMSPTYPPPTNSPTETDPVPGVVTAFASFAPSVISGFRNLENFTGGESGKCMNGFFYCGNMIYAKDIATSRYAGPLPYRQSTSAAASLAGDITYTTYKSTSGGHLWLGMLYSPTASIDSIKIDGEAYVYYNARRYGGISRGSLGVSTVDSRYSGWYYKVATRYRPSINHLIIAEGSSWTHSSYTSGNYYYQHTLRKTGRTSASRLYYLLWVGAQTNSNYRNGYSYSSNDFRNVMNAFLHVIGTTASPTSDTATPTWSPTPKTASPSAAPTSPTSPTTPPSSSPTPSSTSPTVVTPTSCAEYMYLGYTTSGVYTISAKAGSGLPDRSMYCDMEEDGGGWMLLYSYNRQNQMTYRLLNDSYLPISPTAGYSHWHLGPALGYTSADDVVDVRFYCSTTKHKRIIHFKTSNQHVRWVAVSGSHGELNSATNWNTGWTALSNHSAYLPAATTYTSNYGAFANTPFQGNNVVWYIGSFESHCDGYGWADNSTHQVWVRLPGPTRAPSSSPTSPTTTPTASPTSPTTFPTAAPTSKSTSPTINTPTTCSEYMYLGHTTSGVFTISARAGSGLPDRTVYCDMEEDGGGWMLLYSYNRNWTTYMDLSDATLPTSPTTGYSHWHLYPALGYTSADDVLDVRFYCSTSSHSRVVHFKTSDYHIRRVALMGRLESGNYASNWNTGWTALSNHSAYLPAAVTYGRIDRAFYNYPFYGGGAYWMIQRGSTHCDDNDMAERSSHQVWVRLSGPTRAPTYAPTSPTTTPTAAPTSPTTSPTTAPTSPTASPTVVIPASCAEYLLLGHNTSGVYTIRSNHGSGLPDRSVYCDMEEEGGGWMLLYSYNRSSTTASKSLISSRLPTSPTTGYSHWHLGQALGYWNAGDVAEVRFYCRTSLHSRVIHFKTSNEHIRGVAVSGNHRSLNSPSHWNTGWTALSNHSAFLPAHTAYTANAGGFYGSPFYGNNVRWAINSWNSYCDNNGEAGNYSHKVWVRVAGPTIAPTSSPTSPTTAPTRPPTSPTMAPTTTPTSKTLYPTVSPTTHTTSPTITAPTSCVEYMSMGNTTSGVYVIGAKAGSGLPSQNVYCDMEEDGGGWMLIYSYNRKLTTSNRGLETSSLPTSPTNGYSHWHLGPALGYTSNDDVAEVRFYCSTSSHSRVVHFKTSNQHVRRVAVTGGYVSGMSPASWNTGWTALANHSAYLPADTSSTNNYNFLSSPFAANNVAWRISSSYTYCDDNDQPEQSTHQVWVRLAGLTDSPTSAPTSPTSSPTIAPTSPTAAPTTPAPTATPPTSCAEYLRLGHAASGIYTISAKDGSGRPDRSVYCDMEEDGGGWMLLYSYNRNLTTSKSLDGSHLPTSPTTGYSHWHLGPALGYWSADDVLDVRFYCSTSSHSRVMHFKTSNRYVRKLAVSGSSYGNSPSYWNTGWTGLSNHTAYLPADTTSGASYADLYNNPFYGNNVQWVISNSYARCDDNGGVKKSSHQIWVRFDGLTASPTTAPTSPTESPTAAPTSPTASPTTRTPTTRTPTTTATASPTGSPTVVPAASCAEHLFRGHTSSGVYTVTSRSGSGLPRKRVYCDMEEDGGGWMLLYSYNRNLTTSRGLNSWTLPTSPTTGYSHSHLGSALGYTNANDVLDVRFFCTDSFHSRVVHFKTSNRHIRGVAVSGSQSNRNSPSHWNTGWTALSGHSGYLPAGTTSVSNANAFVAVPFTTTNSSWHIHSTAAYCDSSVPSERSTHQVWVRLPGPTRAPTSAPTSPTTNPTAAPTSPTTSPTTAPTSPTTSPTRTTPASCAEYMYWGHTTSGTYTIRAKAGSGLPDRSVYCDMEEDGGGWMLLYSYNRNITDMMYTYRPLDGSHLPTSPTTGYSNWHLGPALGYTSTDDVVDVRFFCETSLHSRVMHFKTSNQHIRRVAVTGSHGDGNSPSHWNTGWIALTNHSALLPAATTYASNDGAFHGYPFQGDFLRWSISDYETQCDHDYMYYYGDIGSSSHQVWVRLAGPTQVPNSTPTSPTTAPTAAPTSPTTSPTAAPTSKSTSPTIVTPSSCAEYMYLGHTASGIYSISAKAGSGLPDRSVYCDMEEDGGGWMLLYSYNQNIYSPYRQINNTHLPTSPTNGYSHWHLGPALGYTSVEDVLDVRFYCSHERHSRVMHFKTSNYHIRAVAVTGNLGNDNSPVYWNTGWTALSHHSAYLPGATTSTNTYGDFADRPFSGNNVQWSIYSHETSCDDTDYWYYYHRRKSSHQIWVRLAGPTKSPSSAPTSPTSTPTAAPTSPTTSPTTTPTSPTSSPTTSPTTVPTSCTEYLYIGHTISGVYTVWAQPGSGLPDRRVYCDMEEDGGGWMLLYSYNRNLTTIRPLDGSHLPKSPTTGYSHVHLTDALGYTSADDVADVRFYCTHSSHSRVMHFKSSNKYIRMVAVFGVLENGNTPQNWTTGWTALTGHSAVLPAGTTYTNNNGAFFNTPFSGYYASWGIYDSYAYCDHYGRSGSSSHQVWVRLQGPTRAPTPESLSPTTSAPTTPTASPTAIAPTTCMEYMFLGHNSGVFTVSAKNGSGLPDRSVYCDMEEDGGGWMLLYSYSRDENTYLALDGSHLPTSPTTGYSHWHLGPALGYTSADDVDDVRLYCSTSRHSRVVHFKTSNYHVREVAVSGSHGSGNIPANWNTGWTALSDHSATLPADAIDATSSGAFYDHPFAGNNGSWSLNSTGGECDDFGGAGAYSFQVWVRLPAPPTLSPTTSSPTSPPTESPTTIPTSMHPTSDQPLKDNWFRKRDVARHESYPQKNSWIRKQANRKSDISNNNAK